MKQTLLLILDGWGVAPDGPGNATSLAHMPNINRLIGKYPSSLLNCSGREVGLPAGFMGNSEVGHMNIGAGRIVYQDMTRIDLAIENNELINNSTLKEFFENTTAAGGRVHFMGLLSDGGVHSHIDHLFALLQAAKHYGAAAVVHAFMDGRDTSPTAGALYLEKLLTFMRDLNWGCLGSICGRYYAMDRDKRWDRVEVAWNALVHGQTQAECAAYSSDPVACLQAAYANGETDEFVKPRIFCPCAALGDNKSSCASPQISSLVQDADSIFFFNFRADRARELVSAFIKPDFNAFERGAFPKLTACASLTRYEDDFDLPVAFEREALQNSLGEVVAMLGLKQLRIAETEKYAHVTYFFNCGKEEPLPHEERCLVNSPRDVPTYDLKPEMSALEVTSRLLNAWQSKQYEFIVCNLANLDMVGHTGNIPAAIKACEVVDSCVGQIAEAVLATGGRLFLTADHGNAEEMLDPSSAPQTAHSLNPVRFVLIEEQSKWTLAPTGKLGDIAPTVLAAWGKTPPQAMTGHNLLQEKP